MSDGGWAKIARAHLKEQNFQVGQLIRAYHRGYHRLLEIQDRTGDRYNPTGSPLLRYRRILDRHGRPARPRQQQCCDALYCVVVTEADAEAINHQGIELFLLKRNNILRALRGEL